MARYLLFLIFLLAFAGITAGIISLMFRRVGQWNYIVKGVAERYGGTLKPGGVLSNPAMYFTCLLYTSPSPRDRTRSRMPSSA